MLFGPLGSAPLGDDAQAVPAPSGATGTAAGAFDLVGAASGSVTNKGAGAGVFPLSGAATGTAGSAGTTGSAAGTLGLGGSAAGSVAIRGAGAGSFALAGAATGISGIAVADWMYVAPANSRAGGTIKRGFP